MDSITIIHIHVKSLVIQFVDISWSFKEIRSLNTTPSLELSNYQNIYVGGWRLETVDRRGEGISKEVDLGEYWRGVLEKYFRDSCRGWTTTVGQGTEDAHLTSESRGIELKGARHNPKVEKGNLALNKKEKKKEGQSSHPLIKCTATT